MAGRGDALQQRAQKADRNAIAAIADNYEQEIYLQRREPCMRITSFGDVPDRASGALTDTTNSHPHRGGFELRGPQLLALRRRSIQAL